MDEFNRLCHFHGWRTGSKKWERAHWELWSHALPKQLEDIRKANDDDLIAWRKMWQVPGTEPEKADLETYHRVSAYYIHSGNIRLILSTHNFRSLRGRSTYQPLNSELSFMET